eukprot:TRINITY_DN6424_c0_g1_i2.p1 TRINITY_DN6424_c0_g1~~TRINITY_DN6424_c0_g1_i2.p1  ORF type:complete len:1430 (+),score=273.03 TRINITY_DN6424_c0_g1_i2:450-4292(+)
MNVSSTCCVVLAPTTDQIILLYDLSGTRYTQSASLGAEAVDGAVAVRGSTVFVSLSTSSVVAYNFAGTSSVLAWTLPLSTAPLCAPLISISGYVTTASTVVRFNPSTGADLGHFTLAGDTFVGSPAVVAADSRGTIQTSNQCIAIFSPATMTQVATACAGSASLGLPIVSPAIVVAPFLGSLIAYNFTGAVLWQATATNSIATSAVVSCSGIIAFGDNQGTVYAVGTANFAGCSPTTNTRSRTRTRTTTHQTRTKTRKTRTATRTRSKTRQTRSHTRTRTRTSTRTRTRTATRTHSRTRTHTRTRTLTRTRTVPLVSAVFTTSLLEVLLTFAAPVAAATVPASPTCEFLFAIGLLGELGNGPNCRFSGPAELTVGLGAGATIGLNSSISVLPNAIRDPNGRPVAGSALLQPPTVPVAPVALVEAPQTIGSCTPLTLSGSSTQSGGASRPLEFFWSVVSGGSNATTPPITAAVWTIAASDLAPATNHVFGLQTRNFLGQFSAVVTISVFKGAADAPQLSGPSSVEVSSAFGMTAIQMLLFPAPCTPANTQWRAEWSFAPSSPQFALSAPSNGTLALVVNPDALQFLTVYNLTVSVNDLRAVPAVALATVLVTRVGASLVAHISGPSAVAGGGAVLELDASLSYDPDNLAGPASYQWFCARCPSTSSAAEGCTLPCNGLASPIGTQATVSVSTNSLLLSTSYLFTVQYSKDSRHSSAFAVVNVGTASTLEVSVSMTQADVLSQLGRVVSVGMCGLANPSVDLVAIATVSSSDTVAWRIAASEVPGFANATKLVPLSVVDGWVVASSIANVVVFSSSELRDWAGYTFAVNFTVTLSGAPAGSGLACVTVGVPPRPELLSVIQVGDKVRISATTQEIGLFEYVVGFQDFAGGTRYFLAFSGSRGGARVVQTASQLTYYHNLVVGNAAQLPCPAASALFFVFICRAGICAEISTAVDLSCSTRRESPAEKQAYSLTPGDCANVPNPFQQALCITQVAALAGTDGDPGTTLALLMQHLRSVPATPLTLLLFASYYRSVSRSASATNWATADTSSLSELLSVQAFPLPDTLSAMFDAVTAQLGTRCAPEDTSLVLFGQQALSSMVCGAPTLVFQDVQSGIVLQAAKNALLSTEFVGLLSVPSVGLSRVALSFSSGVGCLGVVASVSFPSCTVDPVPFVLLVSSLAQPSFVSFDCGLEGSCAVWDENEQYWSVRVCSRTGQTCTCAFSGSLTTKFSVVQSIESPKKKGNNSVIVGAITAVVLVLLAAACGAFNYLRKHKNDDVPMTTL